MLKRFEFDNDGNIDYTPIGDCVDYEEANELLLEAYRAIVDNHTAKYYGSDYCVHCDRDGYDNHPKDCLVLKAEKYVSEVTK